MNAAATAFDQLAPDYDQAFTSTLLGQRLRDAVHERLAARFGAGDHILELGGGTGEDAVALARRGVRVTCTDISPGMVETAAAKVRREGLDELVTCRRLAIEDVEPRVGRFDGLLSNFGPLNCVDSLDETAAKLAACLRPGAIAVLVVMSPGAMVEAGWHLCHGRADRAVRRWRPGGVVWRGVRIQYWRPGAVIRACRPWFRPLRCAALGVLLPPGDSGAWAARHPKAVEALDAAGRALATWPAMPWLADHFVLELERLP